MENNKITDYGVHKKIDKYGVLEIKDDIRKTLINIKDILLIQKDFEVGYSLIHIRDIEEPLRVKIDLSIIADKKTED
jgi:hypothetical protein